MKRILLPYDGSELGDFAYDIAHRVAMRSGAEIHLLSIVPAPAGAFFDMEGNIKDDEGEDLSSFISKRDEVLGKVEKWAFGKTDIKSIKVKIGRVEADILHYAETNAIDLIVMGTSGSQGIEEWLRGSHTQHIVRRSSVPVLSLKCDRTGYLIKDMLLVSDYEEPEEMDLSMVKTLQTLFGARLNLLRINTPKAFEPNRKVKLQMQQFAEMNGLEDVEFHIYCDETVEKGIANFSVDTGIDFILLGTHQRTGLSRLFKKQISEDVVNHIWQPVLTFPVGD